MESKSVNKFDSDPYKGEKEGKLREVGNQAVWSVSSCKPGFGVEQLRDTSLETYWQSDGPQPHMVNIQFRKKTTVSDIFLYADFKADESYTPNRVSVRVGNHINDLIEIDLVEFIEPTGWVMIPLKNLNETAVRAFMIQIAVLSNHQNGRDTHVRHIKIHSPIQDCSTSKKINLVNKEMLQWQNIR
ncbi:hypothetical protein HELRODRAFT_78053 [Helobdella robusta]|uniref:Anaphase-promoting complex subunit 10 n=1 Tax=Helobdella robusta TaxID=6412 RepID=T1G372_HELRO|nr:hypothetical protein HELRODRAFT_78053 [Helobdella robusta]ESO05229.1 hypothetical protein HELRODRAFT_78053 [Helobdella robusta]